MSFNKIYTVIGSRGTGKTPLVMGGDDEKGLAKVFLNKGMSVLVLDTLDHPKYRSLPSLHPDNYKILSEKPGAYRTLADADSMQIVIQKLKSVWNTFIVFEDAYKYVGKTLNRDVRTVIADSKQQNNDLLFMFSCWAWVPPDLIRQTNYFVIFKTADTPDRRGDDLGGCYTKIMQAYNIVMQNKQRYLTVDSGI